VIAVDGTSMHGVARVSNLGRGTSDGLVWLVEHYEPTSVLQWKAHYPHHVEGRIIDAGVDIGPFNWYVPWIDDAAYVFAPSVDRPATS
jgi:hypothetical protein